MKKFLALILVLASVSVLMSSVNMKESKKFDGQGHVLVSLWKEYEVARQDDRPEKSAGILERIKKTAASRRLAWDYYDACRKYVSVKSQRNWKLREELEAGFEEEIRNYSDPLLTVLSKMDKRDADSLPGIIADNAAVLKKSENRGLYMARPFFGGRLNVFSDVIVPSLKNDYEYLLWTFLGQWGLSDENFQKASGLLAEELAGRYPEAALAEYAACMRLGENAGRNDALEAFAKKYESKAVSLAAMQYLMNSKFRSMENTASSADYLRFRSVLESYEKERRMYRGGADGMIAGKCDGFAELIEEMEAEFVQLDIIDGKAVAETRNIDALDICVVKRKSDTTVFRTSIVNPVRSFYVYDTLYAELPRFDDGEYNIVCYRGKKRMSGSVRYDKNTLSIASREDDRGIRVYVADSRTGRPADRADLYLYKGDVKVAEAIDADFDGFTCLPENISGVLASGKGPFMLMCSYRDAESGLLRKSPAVYINRNGNGSEYAAGYAAEALTAEIFKDRSAFNPGDTVRFKGIVYREADMTRKTVPAGTKVLACLCDSDGKVLEEKALETNSFGSVAGNFILNDNSRGGWFYIRLMSDGKRLAASNFRVDEFVLPCFDVAFDKSDVLYFPGDTVKASGRLIDFSGHGLASANAGVIVRTDGKTVLDSPLEVGPDGTFEVSYVCGTAEDTYCSSELTVKVTDATGETLEFSHHESVTAWPSLNVNLRNKAAGKFGVRHETGRRYGGNAILAENTALFECSVSRPDGTAASCTLEYELLKDGKKISGGKVMSGDIARLDFTGLVQGVYSFFLRLPEDRRRGREDDNFACCDILKIDSGNVVLDAGVESFFHVADEDRIALDFGCGNGPLWAVVELFGDRAQVLDSKLVKVGEGSGSCVSSLSYDYKPEYPDGVLLQVLFFKNGNVYVYNHEWRRKTVSEDMQLEFTRFVSDALPGEECRVKVRTSPDAEILAAVFDISTETIMKNRWEKIVWSQSYIRPVSIRSGAGRNNISGGVFRNASDLRIRGRQKMMMYDSVEDIAVEEEAVPFQLAGNNASFAEDGAVTYSVASKAAGNTVEMSAEEVSVRDDFSTTLAFEPFLRPAGDGTAEFRFMAGDKLSTYAVSVFAHDKDMNNAVARRDMLVSMPVKVAVAGPQYLYTGDRYVLRASISNSSDAAVPGTAHIYVYEGKNHEGTEPLSVQSEPVTVPAHGTEEVGFALDVPEVGTLGFKVVFTGRVPEGDSASQGAMVSDAMFVTVPVYAPEQALTEAHSGLLLPGMSARELEKKLRGQFVNVTDLGAEYSEIPLMALLESALQEGSVPSGNNVIAYTEALYSDMLAYGLGKRESLKGSWPVYSEKILSCANPDGGFGWIEGMASSPIVTAVVIERFASLRDRGLLAAVSGELGEDAADGLSDAAVRAVKYLDKEFFAGTELPFWCGAVSMEQYLYIRSFYSGVPFDSASFIAASISSGVSAKDNFKRFRKEAKEWLVPSGALGMNGNILGRVRRTRILMNLGGSADGRQLAEAWGLSSRLLKRSERTVGRDIASLSEYAVEHPSGGYYYPNAVLPWRGLLESEAYAHSAICDLFRDLAAAGKDESGQLSRIAEGIRLWIMIQKESQHWDGDPGFLEAAASVYDGSADVKGAKIVVLKKKYSKPFGEILAAGNGFSVSAEYYRLAGEGGTDMVKLNEVDTVHVGDRIVAKYSLWNEENRSFVLLSVPRPACLRPQVQLSGWSGGWARPLAAGRLHFSPSAYREVKKDRTLYWFDMFPEEKSQIEETFFVVQEGVFQAAVPEIESLYAPHYRANSTSRNMPTWNGKMPCRACIND